MLLRVRKGISQILSQKVRKSFIVDLEKYSHYSIIIYLGLWGIVASGDFNYTKRQFNFD